jgi:hypothetical protein
MHKKILWDVFKISLEQTGEDKTLHHLMILKTIRFVGLINVLEIGKEIAI